MSERLAKPSCLIVASAATAGVSAQSFLHCFTLASSAFNLQVATPGGKPIDFVDVNEANTRWIQDFRMKSYASPAKLESIDGARYHALLIPNCPGAVTDLANSGYLAKILQHFSTESKPICAVGQGVAALCCATNEDKSWVFQGYSLTGVSQAFTLFLLFGGFFCWVISGGFELPVNINYQFGALGLCKMCRVVVDKGPSTGCMKGLSHFLVACGECFPSDCSVNFRLKQRKSWKFLLQLFAFVVEDLQKIFVCLMNAGEKLYFSKYCFFLKSRGSLRKKVKSFRKKRLFVHAGLPLK
uniref:Glutamine amidotransferase-like class 1 domain-containing protein 1 n=1 Tax=Junco hyemalis TaxID=40217 RepID=A0A8C5ICH3_JUNHY